MNRLINYFKWAHLSNDFMREISAECADLANNIDEKLDECPEKTVGLRKLLEAKDCFVRAAMDQITKED